jgi:DNA-directed RNA polymerase specialized sigma24 family protein
MSARCAVPTLLRQTSAVRATPPTESQRLRAAITALDGEQRRALVQCYLRGASVAEAAATLHLPPSTIHSLLHQALHSLAATVAVADTLGTG